MKRLTRVEALVRARGLSQDAPLFVASLDGLSDRDLNRAVLVERVFVAPADKNTDIPLETLDTEGAEVDGQSSTQGRNG
jgi:hypothetical protein